MMCAASGRGGAEARRPVRALGDRRPRRSDSAAGGGGTGSRRPTDRSGRGAAAQQLEARPYVARRGFAALTQRMPGIGILNCHQSPQTGSPTGHEGLLGQHWYRPRRMGESSLALPPQHRPAAQAARQAGNRFVVFVTSWFNPCFCSLLDIPMIERSVRRRAAR